MEMHSYCIALATSVNPAFIGKRILIVEDETLIALDLEDILTRMGFSVIGSTRDVSSSLAFVRTTQIDAAVLDYCLGRETVHPVAQALMSASIPFVLATGLEPGIAYAGQPTLKKPFSFDEIKDCMSSLLATPKHPGMKASNGSLPQIRRA